MKFIQKIKTYNLIITLTLIGFFLLLVLSEIIVRKYFSHYLQTQATDWAKIIPKKEKMINAYIENGDDWVYDFNEKKTTVSNTSIIYSPFKVYTFSGNASGKYFNVKDGERVSFISNNSDCKKYKQINIYGGSAVMGDGWLRDEDLLNHQVGKLLQKHGYDCFKFHNRGQSGYNSKQNFIKFFEINNSKESIHIFYDGVNDFIQNIYSNQSHFNEYRYKALFNYLFGMKSYKEQLIQLISASLNKLKIVQLLNVTQEREVPAKWNLKKSSKLCKKWAKRSSGIYNHNVKNFEQVFFIWQITIDDYKYLNDLELEIKEKTINHLGNIFKSYEIFKNKCIEEFKKNNLILYSLPNLPENKKTLFFDYVHLTPPGNEIVANLIFEIIKDKIDN